MVLYVFNVPRLHEHSQQVDDLHFLFHTGPCSCSVHLPRISGSPNANG